MLKHQQDFGFRIGAFSTSAISAGEIAKVEDILKSYYGPDSDAIVPRDDESEIRSEIQAAAPGLAALAAGIREALESTHSAVIIPKLQLAHLPLSTRKFVLYALTLCMGSPTATDRVENRVIWDILARDETLKSGHLPTYSEHAATAELHTDTQYFLRPERYLSLYFVQPADCGGGKSMLRDNGCIQNNLARSQDGRWAMDFLRSQPLPFRIPTTFTADQDPHTIEVTLAPIFGSRPGIRYRLDTLRRGLEARPDYDTPEARRAIAILEKEIDDPTSRVDSMCQADDFLVINNHEILHGRGSFSDRKRHALRIRIDDPSAWEAEPAA